MQINEITEYKKEVLFAINTLLPQLSNSARLLTKSDLQQIIKSPTAHLLMAAENNIFYGSLTLVIFKIPTGTRAWIEDVVVSNEVRGKGVGSMLIECSINIVNQLGVKTVDLTSRPSREAANALYKKVGFKQRETNVYRYTIT